jgi:hypothetical protein
LVFCTDASVSEIPGSRGAAFEGFESPFWCGSVADGGDIFLQYWPAGNEYNRNDVKFLKE